MGVRRSPEELAAWKQRDPVARLWQALTAERGVDVGIFDQIAAETRRRVAASVEAARAAPYPPESALLAHVYAPQGGAAS